MQILKMTWKIDFVEISMKKSKRGIGSQVRPRGVIGLLVERNKMQVFDEACTRMTSFLRDGVIPCFGRNMCCLSMLSRLGIYIVTSLSPVKGCNGTFYRVT